MSSRTVHCVNHLDLHSDSDTLPHSGEESKASGWDSAGVDRHREEPLGTCTSTSTRGGGSSRLELATCDGVEAGAIDERL